MWLWLKIWLCALLSGITLTFSFAPYNNFFACIFAISTLIYLLRVVTSERRLLRASFILFKIFCTGVLFGVGHFTTSLSWLSNSLLVDIDEFGWLIPVARIGIPLLMSIFVGVFAILAYYILQFFDNKFIAHVNILSATSWHRAIVIPLAIACVWIVTENMRCYLIFPFPWNILGYASMSHLEFAQIGHIIGIEGISFAIVFMCVLIAFWRLQYVVLFITIFCVMDIYGIVQMQWWRKNSITNVNIDDFYDSNHKNIVVVRLVQPNVSADEYYHGGRSASIKRLLRVASLSNVPCMNVYMNGKLKLTNNLKIFPQIVVWPESAVPFTMENSAKMVQWTRLLNFPKNVIVVTGVQTTVYNSIASIYGESGVIASRYDKRILVPFGEYIPLYSIIKRYIPNAITGDGITPGSIKPDFSFNINMFNSSYKLCHVSVAPYICSESIFPYRILDNVGRNDSFIINIANDSWSGDGAGPYQHLNIARFRAIEYRKPMVRVTSNGVSAFINECGEIVVMAKMHEMVTIDVALKVLCKKI